MMTLPNDHIRGSMLAAVSLLALTIATPAAAQDAAPVVRPAADAERAVDEGEIVVTATKRSESISKVPLSIAAFSQQSLDSRGVRDIRDVVNQTPGVDITRPAGGTGQTRIVIRGIDSTAGAATSAVYIDDTPIQARNSSLNYNGSTIPFIFDVDRVEVLRGPQGTLFGASSQGGAIRFITPTPSLTKYSAYGRAAVNSVKDGGIGYEGGLALGGPIVADHLGFRISGYYRENAGWIDRQSWEDPTSKTKNANSDRTIVGRAALHWEPNDWFAATPSVYYQDLKIKDRLDLWTRCPATTGSPGSTGTLNPCPNGASDPSNGKFLSYAPIEEPSHDRFILPALKMVGTRGATSLTSITSYFRRHVEDTIDATQNNARIYFGNAYLFPITPTTPLTIGYQNPDIHQKLFSQELRLTGGEADAPIRYTLGAYYSRSKVDADVPIYLGNYDALYLYRFGRTPAAAGIPAIQTDRIYYGIEHTTETELAAFANVDIKLVDRLTLSLGGRYSRNKLKFDVVERGVSYPPTGVATATGVQKSKPFLPKANLAFQATPTALYYATYSEGYRTGGVNKTLPSTCATEAASLGISPATFEPDRTKSYEVGTKNRVAGGALQYEISGYVVKWKNIQQQLRLQCAFSLVANTASATSKGFDANITLRPTDKLTFGAAVGYVDATYDKTIQIGTAPVVVAGQTLGATPWTINLNGEYHFDVAEHDTYVRAQYNFRTANKGRYLYQVRTATTYDPTRVYPDDADTLDLRAGIDLGHYNVSVYAENVLNNVGYIANAPTYASGPLWKGSTLRPRTIGLQLIARY
jgi:iron complex outermembrane receptor protein